jgi:uncharacterized phosphosugar-binding protein
MILKEYSMSHKILDEINKKSIELDIKMSKKYAQSCEELLKILENKEKIMEQKEHKIDMIQTKLDTFIYVCTCGQYFKTQEEQIEHYKKYNLMKIEPLVLEEHGLFKYKAATQVIDKINELVEQVNKIKDKIK